MSASVLGIVGGGQLGRMLALAAAPLGIRCVVLDPAADACAGHVCEQIVARFDDRSALASLAERCDVVTYEFEALPARALTWLADEVSFRPGVASLAASQDRLQEKRLFGSLGIPTAEWTSVEHAEQLGNNGELIVKTRRGGYDGKGQARARCGADVDRAWATLQRAPAIVERVVAFRRELSVVAVRSLSGDVQCYPVVENVHEGGVLQTTTAPASDLEHTTMQAHGYVISLMEALDHVGVLTLELFDDHEGRLLANEFAPRVHNTGHWTIEGAHTSQFEQHVRAVCGLPLGSCELRSPAVMANLIGTIPPLEIALADPGAHVHLYGKAERAGRKVGHITRLADAGH